MSTVDSCVWFDYNERCVPLCCGVFVVSVPEMKFAAQKITAIWSRLVNSLFVNLASAMFLVVFYFHVSHWLSGFLGHPYGYPITFFAFVIVGSNLHRLANSGR